MLNLVSLSKLGIEVSKRPTASVLHVVDARLNGGEVGVLFLKRRDGSTQDRFF